MAWVDKIDAAVDKAIISIRTSSPQNTKMELREYEDFEDIDFDGQPKAKGKCRGKGEGKGHSGSSLSWHGSDWSQSSKKSRN